ncbi:MAG: SMC family ATPase [Chloroflexus sp.]|nr:SMC family ATPase [Chloroflexus sp.]
MIPLQLSLRNFMCYRASDDGAPLRLDFEGLHVLCLSGENGAGKSTLLDAMTWALWGEARSADDDLIAQGETEMMVELVFALDGRKYRVIRRRQRGRSTGKGTSPGKTWLDVHSFDGAAWRPIGENTIRETQEKINDLLRMSYRTFINASFLLQGKADEFTSATPAERKEVLAEILNLAEYAELEQRARKRVSAFETEATKVRGQLESLQPIAAKIPFWQQAVAEAEERRTQLRLNRAALETAYTTASTRLRELETLVQRQRDVQSRIHALTTEIQRHERQLAELTQRITHDEQVIAKRPVIEQRLAELAAARAELERLEGLRTRYDELIARKNELKQALMDELYRLREELSRAEQARDRLCADVARLAELRQQEERLQQRLRELAPLHIRLAQVDEQRTAIEQQLAQIHELATRQTILRHQLEQRKTTLHAELTRYQQDQRRLDDQLAKAAQWRTELAEAQAAQAAVHALEEQQRHRREQEQATVDTLSTARAAAEQARLAITKLRDNQALLATGDGECPVCRHRLDHAEVTHVMAHYQQELATLQAQADQAVADAQTAEQELANLRAAIAAGEKELVKLRRQAAAAETLARQLAQVAAWETERNELAQQIVSLTERLAAGDIDPAIQAELAVIAGRLAALNDEDSLRRDLRMVQDELTALERQLREQSRIEGELDSCRREIARLQAAPAELPAVEATVAELQRQINENDFAHDIRIAGRQIVAEIDALGYQPDLLETARATARALARWEQEERELLLAEQRYASDVKLREQTQALRDHAERERQTLQAEAGELERQLSALPVVQAEVKQLIQQISDTDRALQAAEHDLAEKRAYLRQAEAAAAELEALQAQEQHLRERIALFAELAEAFGKKGVQAMLIETAIPQLEDEANRLLARLTDGQMHLRFEMQRDTKKGDTVETLDVRIADALGTRNYAAFSGGEAMRINFAIRIALSRLLAHRAGARLETLVIDEGFGTLDADGRERMVEAITAIQRDFARIIVITHIDDLKDRFPAALEIRKTPLGSRWELRG